MDCTTYFVRPQEYVSSVSFGSKKSFHLTVEVTLALCVAIVTQIPNILDRLRTGPLVEKEAKRPEGRGTPLFGLNGDVPLHRVWVYRVFCLEKVHNFTMTVFKRVSK